VRWQKKLGKKGKAKSEGGGGNEKKDDSGKRGEIIGAGRGKVKSKTKAVKKKKGVPQRGRKRTRGLLGKGQPVKRD